MLNKAIDLVVITESWLTDSIHDKVWLQTQQFNDSNLEYYSVPRKSGRKGGGLMLLYNKMIEAEPLPSLQYMSFESQLWQIKLKSTEFSLLAVYHPPSTSAGQVTDSIFIEEFLDLVEDLVTKHKNLVILRDFNLHVNDPSATDAIIFIDAMSALGFNQIVKKETHKTGNTLDLIFIEQDEDPVTEVNFFDFLSDHLWVSCHLKSKKRVLNTVTVKTRKVVDDAGEILKKEFRKHELLSISEVELLTNELSAELKCLYDLIAPETEKKVNDRKRVPWFDHSAKQQKNVVRSIDKKWMKYQEQHQWLAYKREQNRYQNIIKYNKQQTYCGLINNAKGDVKKLYQIAGELLGESRQTPFTPVLLMRCWQMNLQISS